MIVAFMSISVRASASLPRSGAVARMRSASVDMVVVGGVVCRASRSGGSIARKMIFKRTRMVPAIKWCMARRRCAVGISVREITAVATTTEDLLIGGATIGDLPGRLEIRNANANVTVTVTVTDVLMVVAVAVAALIGEIRTGIETGIGKTDDGAGVQEETISPKIRIVTVTGGVEMMTVVEMGGGTMITASEEVGIETEIGAVMIIGGDRCPTTDHVSLLARGKGMTSVN